MEIVGKIIVALPEISGVGASSGKAWKKREYVLETMETYPKKVFFNFWGERADQYPLNVGDVIRLSFDINSREYNNRWYVDISGWKAEPADASMAAAPATNAPTSFGPAPQMPQGYATPAAAPAPPAVNLAPSPTDDLPF